MGMGVKSLKNMTDYLFPTLDGISEDIQVLIADEYIARMMTSSGHDNIVLEEDDGVFH